jgi:hypothetical protein
MRRPSRYDRGYRGRYDRGYDASGGYGRTRGYGMDFGRYGTPFPGTAGYPGARWGWGPIGWAGMMPGAEIWPYADVPGYGFDGSYRTPRLPPEESPTYGRGADRALRRWAGRYGYDLAYAIRPRRGQRRG